MKKGVTLILLILTLVIVALPACAQSSTGAAAQGADKTVSTGTPAPAVQDTSSSTSQGTTVTKPPDSAAANTSAAAPAVKIGDILQNPKTYDGKTVLVQGKIVSECGSGCWFTLKDGNAVIYIDLAPNNMVIPQKKGADARVTAKVVTEGSDVYLIGNKVEF